MARKRKKYTLENYTQEDYERDFRIVDAVEGDFPLDFGDPKRHAEDKENILRNVLGYHGLRIGSNKSELRFLPLPECSPYRKNMVLKGIYYSSLNRINRFGNPSERDKKREPEIKGRIELTGQINLFDF